MAKILTYQGIALKEAKDGLDAYLPSDDLVTAVNIALYLERPLLLMGEPGCGKTRLAEALAYELHGDKWKDHFFSWYVKSTTKAQEGLCQIDNLQRLYDVNMKAENFDPKSEKYHLYGSLASAFREKPNGDAPNILLIDEIDKADIDFPNDLLLELDKKEFVIPETGETIHAQSKVIVIITSNRERELPDAFLRRCIYHYINFPNAKELRAIVMAHFAETDPKDKLLEDSITVFQKLRDIMSDDKKVSTSELLDWFKMLKYCEILQQKGDRTDFEKQLVEQMEQLKYLAEQKEQLDVDKIPFKQTLLKTYDAYQRDTRS